MFHFKQRGGETLKDASYRIQVAQNWSTCKCSIVVLIRKKFIGVTTWYRYILNTITGGSFLGSNTLDAFNAVECLVESPPVKTNELEITLEHLMQILDIHDNKISCVERLEEYDKKLQNGITKLGSIYSKMTGRDRLEGSPNLFHLWPISFPRPNILLKYWTGHNPVLLKRSSATEMGNHCIKCIYT